MKVEHDQARELFPAARACVDHANQMVGFPPALVEEKRREVCAPAPPAYSRFEAARAGRETSIFCKTCGGAAYFQVNVVIERGHWKP